MTQRPALLRFVALALASVFLISGCSTIKSKFGHSKTDKLEGVAISDLYREGHNQMIHGNWDTAITTYKRLIAQYPYGNEAEQAQIETAYAQYKSGLNEAGVTTIDRFIRTYPTHRDIAYMYYLRGLMNSNRDTVFLRRVWSLDSSRRDLATPNQAYNDFRILVDNYPNSIYADDGRARMQKLTDLFARHELEVSLFYLRKGAYVSSLSRARSLLETYPKSQFTDDAVAVMAIDYKNIGNASLQQQAEDKLRAANPNHPYFKGSWPRFSSALRKLNPFGGERSPIDSIIEKPPSLRK